MLALAACSKGPDEPAPSRIPAGLQTRFYPPESWTWGRLRIEGAPPIRYGVAAPPKALKAQVLIVPDAGEPAEAWFETAQELVAMNYGVWIVDLAGQGGSGRWLLAKDRAYTPSMDLDVAAIRAMVTQVVRPEKQSPPLVLVADGFGAQLALRALEDNPPVAGAVLGDPMLKPRVVDMPGPVDGQVGAVIASKIGLGRVLAPGEHVWRENDAVGKGRWAVGQSWMRANADLRVGGASLGWVAAYNRSAEAARDPAALARIKAPVRMSARPGVAKEAQAACDAIRDCRFEPLKVEGPVPHLGVDAVRTHWLDTVAAFIDARSAGRSIGAAPTK